MMETNEAIDILPASRNNLNDNLFSPSSPASRLSRNFITYAGDVLPVCDFLALSVAAYLSNSLLMVYGLEGLNVELWPEQGNAVLLIAIVAAFVLYQKDFGIVAAGGRGADLLQGYVGRLALLLASIAGIVGVSALGSTLPSTWLALWIGGSIMLTLLSRVVITGLVQLLHHGAGGRETVAVVGGGAVADRLLRNLKTSGSVDCVGVFDDRNRESGGGVRPIGTLNELMKLARTRRIDWVLLTLPATADQRIFSLVTQLESLAVPIGMCPQQAGTSLPLEDIDYINGNLPVTLLADRPIKRWDAVVKGAEDFILGGLITLMLLPVLAIVALAIKLDSPGPIIFRQKRHTFNNCEFDIFKFRTMRWSPEPTGGLQQTKRNDPRVTRVGKLLRASSLDELPQLFNVLAGQMSLIGPRPHAVNMKTENRLGHEIIDVYAHRHRVKPGMTGWSQVNGARGATDTTEQLCRRIKLDLYYIENWSLWLDFKILLLTVREVLRGTNAF